MIIWSIILDVFFKDSSVIIRSLFILNSIRSSVWEVWASWLILVPDSELQKRCSTISVLFESSQSTKHTYIHTLSFFHWRDSNGPSYKFEIRKVIWKIEIRKLKSCRNCEIWRKFKIVEILNFVQFLTKIIIIKF